MDLQDFAQLVKKMRDKQKQFFRGDRTAQVVAESKDFERKVDAVVEEILSPPTPGLFDSEEETG